MRLIALSGGKSDPISAHSARPFGFAPRSSEQVGTDEIPVLVTGEGETIEDEILAWLDKRYDARTGPAQHREKMLDKSRVPT